ncbi:hypothetical protein A1O3_09051 [Capronia epimyces CBS 606.96]|uniref:GRF-type domain-containing protein n=1 Tax=Capronia epimyces CBS 606.96 TaxID=1182542 RepID=W9XBQ0_9EURO|nr:uncharacterized protein A1O3_09051 [Capronia epimyces CBS 606.96]EXJ77892.1 hypothetical protein A1O3_09051 [Capronia epimyces CBS 606.96]
MATSYHTRNGRTSKRGAFVDGIWHCDCQPRLPADKLQTKNGGKNHGRWFYTCQKPQHKRCNFFLWNDDAKIREEGAVLNNSRSEPLAQPHTPRKTASNALPPTPDTRPKSTTPFLPRDTTPSKAHHDESFDWSSSNDEELLQAEQTVLSHKPLFETPKKAPRTNLLTSPGKRTFEQTVGQKATGEETWPLSDDVFTTPTTSHRSGGSGLLSPTNTPARGPSQLFLPESEPSTLASEVLTLLAGSHISSKVEKELVDLLNRHDLRTQGIIKGRDISRLAVQSKEQKIIELQARISTLEAEKETNRRVITYLKQDIATSPRKGRPKGSTPARHSDV